MLALLHIPITLFLNSSSSKKCSNRQPEFAHQTLSVTTLWKETRQTHQHSLFAIFNPPPGSKIGGLRTVEAMVKASMVTIRESDHEFSSFLSDLNESGLAAAAANGSSLHNETSELQLCHNHANPA